MRYRAIAAAILIVELIIHLARLEVIPFVVTPCNVWFNAPFSILAFFAAAYLVGSYLLAAKFWFVALSTTLAMCSLLFVGCIIFADDDGCSRELRSFVVAFVMPISLGAMIEDVGQRASKQWRSDKNNH